MHLVFYYELGRVLWKLKISWWGGVNDKKEIDESGWFKIN